MPDIQETGLVSYLLANRAFMAPAVEQAVAAMNLPGSARILDAGTGAGGGLVALARAAGPSARILAVDRNPDAAELARQHADAEGVSERTEVRTADLAEVLDEAASSGDRFAAIWAGDVVWPGNFDDPQALVARAVRALRPGGVLGLFTGNYYQATLLPGHSRLERALRTASELNWGLPAGGHAHYERHSRWLVAAGLSDVHVKVFPRVGSPADADPTVRPYLENAVWPELRESVGKRGADAGLSSAEVREASALLTPGHPNYIVDTAGYFTVHPTLLAMGRRTNEWPRRLEAASPVYMNRRSAREVPKCVGGFRVVMTVSDRGPAPRGRAFGLLGRRCSRPPGRPRIATGRRTALRRRHRRGS